MTGSKYLVASTRPSGQPQGRPDDRTSNAGDEVCGRCCLQVMSQSGMQHSVRYCGAVGCRHRPTAAQSLNSTRWGTSGQCSWSCVGWDRPPSYLTPGVADCVSSGIQYSLKLVVGGPARMALCLSVSHKLVLSKRPSTSSHKQRC